MSTWDLNINEIGRSHFKQAWCQDDRWILKLSVDGLCIILSHCQVDIVLNKKCQKCLSVGFQMPYPCIITLLQYSESLLRLLPVPREITVKPHGQVIHALVTCLLSYCGQSLIAYSLLMTCTIFTETITQRFILMESVLTFSLKEERVGILQIVSNQGMFPVWKNLHSLSPLPPHNPTLTHHLDLWNCLSSPVFFPLLWLISCILRLFMKALVA